MHQVSSPEAAASRGASALTLCRLSRGLSQAELGSAAGIARETISRLERGGTPQLQTAKAIAEALDYPLPLVFPDP